jgi:hypothetical protein
LLFGTGAKALVLKRLVRFHRKCVPAGEGARRSRDLESI